MAERFFFRQWASGQSGLIWSSVAEPNPLNFPDGVSREEALKDAVLDGETSHRVFSFPGSSHTDVIRCCAKRAPQGAKRAPQGAKKLASRALSTESSQAEGPRPRRSAREAGMKRRERLLDGGLKESLRASKSRVEDGVIPCCTPRSLTIWVGSTP
jgi:hypothetical protein